MNPRTKNSVRTIVVVVTIAVVMTIARQGFAWTNPGGAPPFASPSISTSGGNVGIGTANPGAGVTMVGGLTINGTGSTMLTVMNNGTNSFALNPGGVGAAWTMYDYAAGSWASGISQKNGTVGIGTASPDPNYKLTTSGGGIKAETNTAQPAGYFNNTVGSAITVGTGGITLGGVNQTTWPAGTWTTSGTDIYNSNTGNVGIGMTPVDKLTVNGTFGTKGNAFVEGNLNIGVYPHTDSGQSIYAWSNAAAYVMLQGSGDADNYAALTLKTDAAGGNKAWQLRHGKIAGLLNKFDLAYYNGSTWSNSLTADMNGNVGIGTIAPGYKLDVTGTIHTTGDFLADGNYGLGLVGLYDPTKYRNVYSMGTSYRLLADGSGPGSLYGIAMTYEPNYGGAGNNAQAIAGLGHQFLFMSNGVTQSAVGTGVYTVGNMTALGTVTAQGGSSSNWAAVNAPSFNAGGSIYSYGSICTGNASGVCSGINGTVLGIVNTSAANNIPNSGAVFFNSGNVGIGTTAPAYKLDVNGTINATAVQNPTYAP